MQALVLAQHGFQIHRTFNSDMSTHPSIVYETIPAYPLAWKPLNQEPLKVSSLRLTFSSHSCHIVGNNVRGILLTL